MAQLSQNEEEKELPLLALHSMRKKGFPMSRGVPGIPRVFHISSLPFWQLLLQDIKEGGKVLHSREGERGQHKSRRNRGKMEWRDGEREGPLGMGGMAGGRRMMTESQ